MILKRGEDDVYVDLSVHADGLTRYTVFMNWDTDGDGFTDDTDEIEVLAATRQHAEEIALAAGLRDFITPPVPTIAHVEEVGT